MVFGWFKSRKNAADPARELYITIVDRMREPIFYEKLGVPDTLEGRYDLLLVHAFLVFHRLTKDGEDAKDLSQRLFDVMMADIDQNLRELGIGDQGILHRIKAMTEAYHGRVVVYNDALKETADEELLQDALNRNLYGTTQVSDECLAEMSQYVRAQVLILAEQTSTDLQSGKVHFGPLPSTQA